MQNNLCKTIINKLSCSELVLFLTSIILTVFIIPYKVRAFDVAVAPVEGEAVQEKLDSFALAEQVILEKQGHKVFSAKDTLGVMEKVGLKKISSLQDADLIGAKLKVQFVIVTVISPMAGQDSIEIKAYYLPDGRIELLEEMAGESELNAVLEGMLTRLVTREGVSGPQITEKKEKETKQATPPSIPVSGEENLSQKGAEEKKEEENEEESEKLLKDLESKPVKKQTQKYGTTYRASVEIKGGPFVLLNKPVSGNRAGGTFDLSVGYVAVKSCGCDFGGEVKAFFGTTNAFSLTGYGGFNLKLSNSAPVYGGGRVSIGYLKNLTGATMNRMILRFSPNLNIVLRDRFMILLSPAAFSLLLFEGDPAGFYEAEVGFGVRF